MVEKWMWWLLTWNFIKLTQKNTVSEPTYTVYSLPNIYSNICTCIFKSSKCYKPVGLTPVSLYKARGETYILKYRYSVHTCSAFIHGWPSQPPPGHMSYQAGGKNPLFSNWLCRTPVLVPCAGASLSFIIPFCEVPGPCCILKHGVVLTSHSEFCRKSHFWAQQDGKMLPDSSFQLLEMEFYYFTTG